MTNHLELIGFLGIESLRGEMLLKIGWWQGVIDLTGRWPLDTGAPATTSLLCSIGTSFPLRQPPKHGDSIAEPFCLPIPLSTQATKQNELEYTGAVPDPEAQNGGFPPRSVIGLSPSTDWNTACPLHTRVWGKLCPSPTTPKPPQSAHYSGGHKRHAVGSHIWTALVFLSSPFSKIKCSYCFYYTAPGTKLISNKVYLMPGWCRNLPSTAWSSLQHKFFSSAVVNISHCKYERVVLLSHPFCLSPSFR